MRGLVSLMPGRLSWVSPPRAVAAILCLLFAAALLVSTMGSQAYAALGTADAPTGANVGKVSAVDGTCDGWRIIDVPQPNYALSAVLHDVVAVASNDIWAVGATDHGDNVATLIAHSNGQSWTIVPSPNIGGDANVLMSVAAASANDIWAVGYTAYVPGAEPGLLVEGGLIAHWDGASWSVVAAPGSGTRGSHLTDVVAFSANDAWAVGSWYDRFSYAHTLTLHWDGVAWSVVPSPEYTLDGALVNNLEGVSAVAPNDIWAVGSYQNDPPTYRRSLLLHWNGSAWSLVPPPTNEFTFNSPLDVVALSETDAWAVGLAVDTGGRTLMEHWDGDEWSVVGDADLASRANLVGIDAISPTNIWAVGTQDNPSNSSQLRSLVEWWDGDAWNLVPSPNMFNGEQNVSTALESVAAIASRDVWAVGAYLHGQGNLPGEPTWPFSMHYSTGSCATATPIPTATPTITPVPVATVVGCGLEFADVPPDDTFYPYARCLTCKGSISGYACGGVNPVTGEPEPCGPGYKPYFRPGNPVSRGQIAKMVSQSAGFNEPAGSQIYEDVPPGSPFYDFVQRLSHRAVMGGYPCGQPGTEPCVAPANRPNFRPDALATRGHISKIVSNAAGFEDEPTTQKFEDVPPANPFYVWVERLGGREVMGGYPCGTVDDEPCVGPENRPYFRYGRTVTRGQAAKIVSNTFFPNCDQATPTPTPLATVTPTITPAPARKTR